MPKIPDEQKPAIGKVIAPAALFYFRWAAFGTIVSGLILQHKSSKNSENQNEDKLLLLINIIDIINRSVDFIKMSSKNS